MSTPIRNFALHSATLLVLSALPLFAASRPESETVKSLIGLSAVSAGEIPTTTDLVLTTPATLSYGQMLDGYAQATATDNSPLAGTISFYDGTQNICTIPVKNDVSCPATTGTGLAAGRHLVTAVYSGDAIHAASTSAAAIVTVLSAPAVLEAALIGPGLPGRELPAPTFCHQPGTSSTSRSTSEEA